MATFILKWNPAISSFTMEDCKRLCELFPFGKLNWSVWEHDKVQSCDNFYMVRVGDGVNGIVMRGMFASKPSRGSDWSGKGRVTYYCDLYINFIVDSETQPILTSEELEKAIPDFDWRRGHSGVRLTDEQEEKLDKAFAKYEKKNKALCDEIENRRSMVVQKPALETIPGGKLWDEIFGWKENEADRYTESATHDCVNLSFAMDYDSHEFRLAVLFCDEDVLHIKCSKLYSFKADMSKGEMNTSWFKLSKPYKDAYALESNGLTIICGEVEFEKVTQYDKEFIPVTI